MGYRAGTGQSVRWKFHFDECYREYLLFNSHVKAATDLLLLARCMACGCRQRSHDGAANATIDPARAGVSSSSEYPVLAETGPLES